MPSYKTPISEEIDHAVALLARPEQRRYFFDKLNNPRWLTPLQQRGFFDNPPAPIKDNDKGTIQFPPWPASRYLARMARIPDAQADVFRIAQSIPDTENITVHADLAEIATQLPAKMAAQLSHKVPSWLASPYHLSLADTLATLIDHLARNSERAAAERLAKATLTVSRKEHSDVTAHFEPWHYGRIIATITPALVENLGLDALTLFSELLQTAAPPYTKDGAPTTEDGSRVWHSKIEIDEDLLGIRNILVIGTRNVAAQLAHQNPAAAARVVAALEAVPAKVFHRIALDILRREKDFVPELVTAHVTDKVLFEDTSLKHEYQRLLHDAFPNLSPQSQETILSWINEGPPAGQYEAWEAVLGQPPSGERAARYKKVWQRGHLTPMAYSLPSVWADRYQAIVHELGPEEELGHGLVGPFVGGQNSPITKEELTAMTPSALMEYFAAWQPADDFFGPSRAGIGLHLTNIIATDPTRLDTVLRLLRTLHPTYLRSYYYGLREAIEKGRAVSWSGVLDLADWVVTQPYTQPAKRDPFHDDEDWGSTRAAIADLLGLALTKNIPIEHRDPLWRIIHVLTQDPEPTIEFEHEQGEQMDAALLAINTTRGKAVEAVIKYALWLRRFRPAPRDFSSMPEVPEVLDDHLKRDESRAIRSVYGRFFPWLVSLDRTWTAEHTQAIFGDLRGEAAWEAYLTFCPAYDDAVALLSAYYERAVNALTPATTIGRRHKPDSREHLGEHLMAEYWRGKLPLSDGLVPRFFEHASATMRAHALAYVGRSLYGSEGPLPEAIKDRLVALWTARKQAAITAVEERRGELTAFGWWFAAGKLDTAWELWELRDVLRITHRTDHDTFVVKRLAALAPSHPMVVLDCLQEIIKGEQQHWTILGTEKEVRTILAIVLQCEDPVARALANTLIHHLGVIGYTNFRSLLQAAP